MLGSAIELDQVNSQLELVNENLAEENCRDPHAFVLNRTLAH